MAGALAGTADERIPARARQVHPSMPPTGTSFDGLLAVGATRRDSLVDLAGCYSLTRLSRRETSSWNLAKTCATGSQAVPSLQPGTRLSGLRFTPGMADGAMRWAVVFDTAQNHLKPIARIVSFRFRVQGVIKRFPITPAGVLCTGFFLALRLSAVHSATYS